MTTARRSAWVLATVALAARAPASRAEPPTPADAALAADRARPVRAAPRGPHLKLAIAESIGVMLPSTIYYWSTTNLQKEDWELDWDWDSWRYKLTSLDSLVVDTGTWEANAMRHPLAGALAYQVGRANGYGPAASSLVDFLSAVAWEYFAEFKERISLNDIVTNTSSGFLVGEPLYQLGRIADAPGAGWARRGLAAVTSPVRRLYRELRIHDDGAPPLARSRVAVELGGGAARHGTATYGEARVALAADLAATGVEDAPGAGGTVIGPGAWSRVDLELRSTDDGLTAIAAHTATTYGGWFDRDHDDDGRGTHRFVGFGAGFDYDTRQLAAEWDRTAVFHLLAGLLALGRTTRTTDLRWELAVSGDLGMIQAHAFGPAPPFDFDLTSVVRARGYYYATGVSAATRIAVETPSVLASLAGRASHAWSIDGFDRVELNGGPDDPADPEWVADERFYLRGKGGVKLGADGLSRAEVVVDAVARRGTWSAIDRWTTELAIGVQLAHDL